MGYFAKVNVDNVVVQLLNIPDEFDSTASSYISDDLGLDGTWLPAHFSNSGTRRYVDIGYTYVATIDRFIPPQPFPSWVLNESFEWSPPVPHPKDGLYTWNEGRQSWDPLTLGI